MANHCIEVPFDEHVKRRGISPLEATHQLFIVNFHAVGAPASSWQPRE
jgi:hypothetical protein